jgi:hypothetical protein
MVPSHCPPHGPAPAHAGLPPRTGPSTGVQKPSWVGKLQAKHCSVHGSLQQ